ncbi:hypothetical protein LCGC14_0710050 [marine sediment metagenome]|uniref:DUF2127 domain-containing protein n=1 Tax=marine sediment metagenome TaxID=412755 RepID=A0A0F9R0V8_9ZZZZ
MTEIKKITKISILAYGIVCLIFAIMLIFLLDFWIAAVNMPTWLNEFHPRGFGGALLVVVFFAIFVLFNKDWEWEKIKVAYLVVYSWLPINIIMEVSVTAIFLPTLSNELLSQIIMDVILMSILLVLGVYSYIKQRE